MVPFVKITSELTAKKADAVEAGVAALNYLCAANDDKYASTHCGAKIIRIAAE